MAKSASAISVGPETVPPGRSIRSLIALAQQAGLAVGALDGDIVAAEGLGNSRVQKRLEFSHAHFRNRHVPLRPALASRRLLH